MFLRNRSCKAPFYMRAVVCVISACLRSDTCLDGSISTDGGQRVEIVCGTTNKSDSFSIIDNEQNRVHTNISAYLHNNLTSR